MRYVTHQFAHVETLERARRWLVLAGIGPGRLEAHTHGILRLVVVVEGESAEVQHVIDVAEASDPDGHPGFWKMAGQSPSFPRTGADGSAAHSSMHAQSFVFGWHPQDADRDLTQIETGVELQKRYQEARN
jgi:hypothetical protein